MLEVHHDTMNVNSIRRLYTAIRRSRLVLATNEGTNEQASFFSSHGYRIPHPIQLGRQKPYIE